MPKNKTGGKKSRKKSSKYENEYDIVDEKNIIKPTELQEYGIITKVCGNSRMLVDCLSCKKQENSDENVIKNRMSTIRGKLKKRAWMNVGDVVIVALRDFNDDRGDIVHKYSSNQANFLRKNKYIPFDLSKQNSTSNVENNIIDEDFDFEDYSDNENNLIKSKVGIQKELNFPTSESSDYESEEEGNLDIENI